MRPQERDAPNTPLALATPAGQGDTTMLHSVPTLSMNQVFSGEILELPLEILFLPEKRFQFLQR